MNEESEDQIPTKVTLLVDDIVTYSHNFRGAEIIEFGDTICGSKIQLMFEPEEPYTPEQVTCRTQDVRGTRMENNIGFVYGEVDVSFSCTGTLDYQVHETAGDLTCRSGYEEITTEAECQSAATALGYEFSGDLLINNPNRMPYCWVGQGTRVNFNHNEDTGSNFADTPARILCQLSNRNGQECWTAGGCGGDTGEICEWCGLSDGKPQLCCRPFWETNHPNCDGARYESNVGHQCVVEPNSEPDELGPLVDLGSDGCTANSPCGQCEGDCD